TSAPVRARSPERAAASGTRQIARSGTSDAFGNARAVRTPERAARASRARSVNASTRRERHRPPERFFRSIARADERTREDVCEAHLRARAAERLETLGRRVL